MRRRPVDTRRRVAEGLAGAFLAGDWEPPAMARRGKRALRDQRGWLLALAEAAHAAYPDRPADRPRELAAFLAECPPLVEALADPERPPKVHTWMATPTAMRRDGTAGPRTVAIPDLDALARWLGASPAHLAWFADRRSMERTVSDERLRHYHRRWVTKADGSGRLLEAPKRELKDLQRQVLHGILDGIGAPWEAHGFRPGRSVHTAAALHAGRQVVVRLDLEAFFAGVGPGRVHGTFRRAGYPEPVAHTLTGLCTTVTPLAVRRAAPRPDGAPIEALDRRRRLLARLAAPHLPQGAPTSPALANLAAAGFDRRVSTLARHLGLTYTRYADDLAISGDRRLLRRVDHLVERVGAIARDEGFRLHDGKTRVRTAAQRQTVAGLVVNRAPQVPRDDYDRLRAVLHDAARSGPAAANRAGHPDFRAHLLGRIAWVGAGNPARDAKLRRAFAAIDWP